MSNATSPDSNFNMASRSLRQSVRHPLDLSPRRFAPLLRWGIGALGLCLLLVFAVWVFVISGDATRFPVNEVEVLGTLDYTDRDELRELVVTQTQNGFYRLDVDEIRLGVIKLPWLAEAHVRRVWPDRLSIEAVEHEPAARWNDDSLISKKFELFRPPQLEKNSIQRAEWLAYFSQFPQLAGADGRHHAVLSGFRTMQIYLQEYEVRIEALTEDDRRSESLVLSNNVTVELGNTDVEERMQRFVSIYKRLVEPFAGRTVKFDMRYANGFSMTRFSANILR